MKTFIYLALCLVLVGNGIGYAKHHFQHSLSAELAIKHCNQLDCNEL